MPGPYNSISRIRRGVDERITGLRHWRADEFRAYIEEQLAEAEAARAKVEQAEATLAAIIARRDAAQAHLATFHASATHLRDAAQAILNARARLPEELLLLLNDPHIHDTLASIADTEIPDLPEPAPEHRSQDRRDDENDDPAGPGQ